MQVPLSLSSVGVAFTNVTSISLPAGDWDVSGIADFLFGGGSTTQLVAGSSATSATFGPQDTFFADSYPVATLTNVICEPIPTARYVFTTTTTVFMIVKAAITNGTVTAYGTIRARRYR